MYVLLSFVGGAQCKCYMPGIDDENEWDFCKSGELLVWFGHENIYTQLH